MSSKLSKSDRTKSKFAQSNINHLYKGNSSEPHHKPAVRQYGMQVVGKLQGTRRLPPPAWVPSLKAESGGLDSRVTLVPPGGGGWGAPTVSEAGSTSGNGSAPSEMPGLATTVNGSLVPENIGTSFEPAFAKPGFGSSTADDAHEAKKANVSAEHEASLASNGEQSSQPVSVWSSRSQSTAVVGGGGLAANKPFFQRPIPTVSTNASTVSSASSTRTDPSMHTKNTSQAGPTSTTLTESSGGWAAVINEEPDFDEHILFSDEEAEGTSEIVTKTTSAVKSTDHPSPVVTSALESRSLSPTIGSGTMVSNLPIAESVAVNPLSMNFVESSNMTGSSVWHSGSAEQQSHSHAPQFATPLVATHRPPGDIGSLVTGQYGQSSIRPLHQPLTFQDAYFPGQPTSERSVSSGPSGIMDYILPTGDIESELQHAQRQMRTQECNIAVDRARMARMKSNVFQTEGDSFAQRSAGLLADRLDAKPVSAIPITTTTMTALGSMQPPLQQFINNFISSPFFSSVQQQGGTGPGRPDLVAAVAAATAAAFAYGGGGTGTHIGASAGSVNTLHSKTSSPSLLVPSSTSTTWKGPYTTSTSTTLSPFLHTPRPQGLPQALQNAFAMACNNTTFPSSAAPSNAVYLDPDCFVERFLEIFNKQQAAKTQKTSECSSNSVPPTYMDTVTISNESNLVNRVVNSSKRGSVSEFAVDNSYAVETLRPPSAMDDLSAQLASHAKLSHKPIVTDHASGFPDYATDTHSVRQTSDVQTLKQHAARVPGLMDVQVSSSVTQHLAHIWEKNECLSDSISRTGRGRGKQPGSERMRGRGRHTPVHILNGDTVSHRSKTPVLTDAEAVDGRFTRTQHAQGHSQAWQTTAPSVAMSNSDSKYDHDYPLTTCPNSTWNHHSEPTHVVSVAHRFRESEQDDLSDIVEDEPGDELLYAKHASQIDDKSTRQGMSASTYKPHESQIDVTRAPYTDHSRRGDRTRRGRGSTAVQFTHARSDKSEGYSSNRYTGVPDHSSYQAYDQRKRPSLDETKVNARDNPHAPNWSETSTRQGTYNQRSNYYQSGEQNAYDQNRSYYTGRRYNQASSYTKYRTGNNGGTFSASANYFDQQHFSDGEHPYSKQPNRDNRQNRVTSSRNRSQGTEQTNQGKSRLVGSEKRTQLSDIPAEQNVTLSTEDSSADQIAEQPTLPDSSPQTVDDYDASDIPTVRVPAVDNSYRFTSFSRGSGRFGTFPRGSASRRGTSGRTNPTQHQKRSTGGGSQQIDSSSRKYRDHHRYRDGKDGGDGGGASAGGSGGGTGRSALGAGGGDSTPTVGNNSGTGGSSGGQNNGGGHKDDGDHGAMDAELAPSVDNYNDNNKRLSTCTYRSCTDSITGYSRRCETSVYNPHGRHAMQSSGGRSIGGQGFSRYATNLSYTSYQRSHTAHIPPLMSITPQGPFARDPARFDAMLDAGSGFTHPRQQQQAPVDQSSSRADGYEHCRQHSEGHNSTDPSQDDPDNSSILSDGFTKVVSKASKKNAKRRLHQELSATLKNDRSQKTERSERSTDVQHNQSKKTNLVRSPTSKSKSDDRTTITRKPKTVVRANFTGPPLSTISTSVATSVRARMSSSTTQNMDTGVTHSRLLPHSSVVTSTRTWSKVVGTKSVSSSTTGSSADSALPQVTTSLNPNSSAALPSINNNLSVSICPKEPVSTINSPHCSSHSAITSEVDATYNSLQALWKSGQLVDKVSTDVDFPVSTSAPVPVSTTSVSTSSLSAGSIIAVSNNICKVRPQQQQQPSPLTSASNVSSTRVPILVSMSSVANVEPSQGSLVCSNDLVSSENCRPDCEYGADVRSVQAFENGTPVVPCTSRGTHSSWVSSVLPSNASLNQFGGKANHSQMHSVEGPFSAPFWSNSESAMLDPPSMRTGDYTQPYGHVQSSDPLANLLANPTNAANSSLPVDISTKQLNSAQFSARSQAYGIQPYTNLFPSNETHGGYEGIINEVAKLPSHLQQAPFTSVSGSMFVPPQQQQQPATGQPAHPFSATWAIQHNQQSNISQPMAHTQRYRQRLPQVDPAYGGFPYPTEFQNEYAFQHSGTGVQAPPTGGLYSAIQGQAHSNFPQTSGRQTTVGHPVANGPYPWSLLGTPTGPIGFQPSSQDYSAAALTHAGIGVNGTNGGLLPHPVAAVAASLAQGGHSISNSNCTFTPVSSSVGTNCVGVIGGGRPGSGTQLPPNATRPRGLHQNLYVPPHNHLAYSPSAQNHQLQLQSAFYSSLSPSHQRVSLQQFTGSQGRAGLLNQSSGLYAAALAASSHPTNQPTPPPLSNQMAYAPNLSIEPAPSAPNPFHSSAFGVNSFPTLTQEPTQHTNPYILQRNFGPIADSRSSNLPPYSAAVGLAGGHAHVPVSMSGFPAKHMLSL